jgi:hypothetical protein
MHDSMWLKEWLYVLKTKNDFMLMFFFYVVPDFMFIFFLFYAAVGLGMDALLKKNHME